MIADLYPPIPVCIHLNGEVDTAKTNCNLNAVTTVSTCIQFIYVLREMIVYRQYNI
jgi:hypothetical protein